MTQFTPYWWQDQPQYRNTEAPPAKADCIVVGAEGVNLIWTVS